MARNWIVQGDPTSSGGTVVSGSPFTDIDGTPVARITDQATCPAHKGVFPIIDGDATLVVDGQPVALHGSSLACGCKVLSAAQMHVFVDVGSAQAGAGSSGSMASAPEARAIASETSKHDEAFILKAKLTGKPLANRGYRIVRQDGSVEHGTTDQEGRTHLVETMGPELLKVELEEESPE